MLKIRKSAIGFQRDTYIANHQEETPNIANIIDCSIGSSQWGMSANVAEAHRTFDVSKLANYHEPFSESLLVPALLKRYLFPGIERSMLFFGHGSFNLIERVLCKLVEPGTMLGWGPQFNEVPSEYISLGGRYISFKLETENLHSSSVNLFNELESGEYSILYLDNPNNPTGYAVELDFLRRLTERAEEQGTIVVIDEAYGDFLPDESSAIRLTPDFSNLIVVRSFSKCLGLAAERIGYMFMSTELARVYRQLDIPFEPGIYAATIASATLSDTNFLAGVRSSVYIAKQKILTTLAKCTSLQVLPSHPTVSIFTLHCTRPCNLVAAMAQVGIRVEPGSAFRNTNASFDDSYCRVRVPSPELVDEFCRRILSGFSSP